MNRKGAQRGYALLVTLLMLGLLSVILAGLARRSVDCAVSAREAESAVRYRWAELTCRQTLLAGAPHRFDQRIEDWRRTLLSESGPPMTWGGRPAAYETLALELEGVRLWLRIEDEQAKLNLNRRLQESSDAWVSPAAVLSEWTSPAFITRAVLTRPEMSDAFGYQSITSWAQIAPGQDPLELRGIVGAQGLCDGPTREGALATRLTLWGSGRLNIDTSKDETLRRRLRGVVESPTIERLLRLRRDTPQLDLQGLIANAAADEPADRPVLTTVLTEDSTVYSLWIAGQSMWPDGAAVQWSLTVIEDSDSAEASSEETGTHYHRW